MLGDNSNITSNVQTDDELDEELNIKPKPEPLPVPITKKNKTNKTKPISEPTLPFNLDSIDLSNITNNNISGALFDQLKDIPKKDLVKLLSNMKSQLSTQIDPNLLNKQFVEAKPDLDNKTKLKLKLQKFKDLRKG